MRTRLEAGEGAAFSTKTALDPSIKPAGISKSTKVGTGTRLETVPLRAFTVALKFVRVVFRLVVVVVKLAMEVLI
jgi:hypothetical protein